MSIDGNTTQRQMDDYFKQDFRDHRLLKQMYLCVLVIGTIASGRRATATLGFLPINMFNF